MNETQPPSAGRTDRPGERKPLPPGLRRASIAFFGVGTFVAGLGFVYKIHEFTEDLLAEEGIRFAGVHLLTYGLVAAGFLALLAFAFFSGHFSDVEAPKYDMLEQEREHDLRDLS